MTTLPGAPNESQSSLDAHLDQTARLPDAPDTAGNVEVSPSAEERQEVKLTTAEDTEGLYEQTATSQLEQYQPPSKPAEPEAEDSTSTGAFDKIGKSMQKMFEMVQKFMKQIQSMGSSTLRGMASTLAMLGFKKAAEWLNEMAGADYAELVSALKKGNLTLSAINPEDAHAKAQTELAEGAQTMLAEQYKVLAQTRGPTFTREVYYGEVVREWKKNGGNSSKTEVTAEDLQQMVATAKELPAVLPGQVAQGPEFVPPLESVTTTINVLGSAPVKVLVNKQAVALQVLPTGEWNIAVGTGFPVRYRMVPENSANVPSWLFRTVTLSADGLRFEGKATYQDNTAVEYSSPKLVAMADVHAFLEKVAGNPANAQHTGGEFRFERIPA